MAKVAATPRQVKEIIKCGKDASYFMNKYCKIEHPLRGIIPFATYPFQDDCLKDFEDHRINVVVKSRQMGISTLAANYSLWMALFRKGKKILVIATKRDVAMEFIGKVKVAFRNLPKWLVLPDLVGDSKSELEFSNASRVKAIGTSADAGRGGANSLVVIDEAAFIKDFDTIWTSLSPTIALGGRALIISTPNGASGRYYELYRDAESGATDYNHINLHWTRHPERDADWYARESQGKHPREIAQEYDCSFEASGHTFLDAAELKWLEDMIIPPFERVGPQNGLWRWKNPIPDHKYMISADIARGDGKDFSCFHVIDVDEAEVVAEWMGKLPPDDFGDYLVETAKYYNEAFLIPENNSWGYAALLRIQKLGYEHNLYKTRRKDPVQAALGISNDVLGFSTQGHNRPNMLSKMQAMVRNKEIRLYSSRLLEQFKTFVWKGSKPQANSKKDFDDLVLSFAIGCFIMDGQVGGSKRARETAMAILDGISTTKNMTSDLPGMDEVKAPSTYSQYESVGVWGSPGEMRKKAPSFRLKKEWDWIL